jgi:hypothetical protein
MPRAQKKEATQEVKPPVTPSVTPAPLKLEDMSFMDQVLHSIHDMNMNPYLLGIAYITLNLGSRFFVMSVSPGQEAFLQNTLFRPLLVFAIMFIGTRNLIVAFWMSALILFSLYFLLNENSSWFILRDWTATHST